MPERIKTVLAQLVGLWKSLSTAKRLALIFVTTSVLLGALALAFLGSRQNFSILYADLPQEDAGKIVEKLDALKVPYRVERGGSAVLVPEEKVHQLRLELAKSGLPRGGGVGFELFDKSQIGSTEFEQRVNLRRALEGELARSIATVEGVSQARVHLVLPERRLFAADSEKASASVVLKLQNPGNFGKREVAGIVHLVSAAVPGLARDRVSVVSTEGLTLHRPASDTGPKATEAADLHGEQSREVAGTLEQRVKEQLERVVGPGNADVRIHVALDPATRERTEEHYDQAKTALRSEHKVEELAGGEAAGVAGVPGARTNLPDAVAPGQAPAEDKLAEGAPGGGGALRRSHTRNWEVDRVTEKTMLPPGDLERVSVAVLLNGRYEDRGGRPAYVPRSAEELKSLEEIVKRAVGFDEKRGDSIKLETMEFARLDGDRPPPSIPLPLWRKYLPHAVGGFAALLALGVYVLVRRKRRKAARKQALASSPVRVALTGLDADAPQLEQSEVPRLDAAASAEAKEIALEIAARDPATAAVVLRKWLGSAGTAPAARP
ncbi:MAG: flagellar M-ring protein FliF [Polyangiaceae bacterium]|nr:flagellar M-ring protein FliF [Polyangiaceae bacterium]